MTGIRRPNRRPIPELVEAAAGALCPGTGKQRFLTERHAAVVRDELARRDPDGESLEVYRHGGRGGCGDWHVGHNRRPVPRGKEDLVDA